MQKRTDATHSPYLQVCLYHDWNFPFELSCPLSFFLYYRGHASHFLTQRISQDFEENNCDLIHIWKRSFLLESDMWGIYRRIKDIIILTGKKYNVPQVKNVISNFSNPTSSTIGSTGFPWDIVKLDNLSSQDPFYCRSPFGKLALELCHKHAVVPPKGVKQRLGTSESFLEWEEEDQVISQTRKNRYYSPEFLEYLIIHIFPLTPLFNHSLLYLNNMTVRSDTNAVSESWNAVSI